MESHHLYWQLPSKLDPFSMAILVYIVYQEESFLKVVLFRTFLEFSLQFCGNDKQWAYFSFMAEQSHQLVIEMCHVSHFRLLKQHNFLTKKSTHIYVHIYRYTPGKTNMTIELKNHLFF